MQERSGREDGALANAELRNEPGTCALSLTARRTAPRTAAPPT